MTTIPEKVTGCDQRLKVSGSWRRGRTPAGRAGAAGGSASEPEAELAGGRP